MIIDQNSYQTAKFADLIVLKCDHCSNEFSRAKRDIHQAFRVQKGKHFCSKACASKFYSDGETAVCCTQCSKQLIRRVRTLKSKNVFCSKRCSAIYRNANKHYGTRISKLEKWLQSKLADLYPSEQIIFNSSSEIGYELDIFFPRLNLAFEINGIHHYRKIYSQSQFERIQQLDSLKLKLCDTRGIKLIVVDTSKQSYFTIKSSLEFLKKIETEVAGCTEVESVNLLRDRQTL